MGLGFLLSLTFSAPAVTFTVSTNIEAGNMDFEAQPLIVSGCTLTVNGTHSFASILLTNTAVLTHSPAANGNPTNRLDLTITGDLIIAAGSRIDASGMGYSAASGPGAGQNPISSGGAGGASHGGDGGNAASSAFGTAVGGRAYDSLMAPAQPGSGGGKTIVGPGSAGGGVIWLNVSNILRVDGSLIANGAGSSVSGMGGGAGGSINISAGILAGIGSIAVIGGQGGGVSTSASGGGAGGRVALKYGSNSFSGTVSARGGNATGTAFGGGAGTIYQKLTGVSVGTLSVDNAGISAGFAASTPLSAPEAFNVLLANYAFAYVTSALSVAEFVVKTNATLSTYSWYGIFSNLVISAESGITVEKGGTINCSSFGYAPGTGPGAGGTGGGGGGHGGQGGAANVLFRGATNGSVIAPMNRGSGGGNNGGNNGGWGGGAIRMRAKGTLRLDGKIAADGDGTSNTGGGGAGGSVYLVAADFAGSGSISASGATNSGGGGSGGGGRIAIYRTNSTFTGTILANGGGGTYPGGAGTVFQASPVIISGTITTTNGAAVVEATVGAIGIVTTTTGTNGEFSLVVPTGWNGSVVAVKSGMLFTPASRDYAAITSDQPGQDFLGIPLTAPALEMVETNSAVRLQWPSISGVQYMIECSTNLVDWTNFLPATPGTGNYLQTTILTTNAAPQFFRLSATN